MYLEDRRHAILQVAAGANITITYKTKKRRTYRPAKPPEKRSSLHDNSIPTAKKAIGTHVSVEFYDDPVYCHQDLHQ